VEGGAVLDVGGTEGKVLPGEEVPEADGGVPFYWLAGHGLVGDDLKDGEGRGLGGTTPEEDTNRVVFLKLGFAVDHPKGRNTGAAFSPVVDAGDEVAHDFLVCEADEVPPRNHHPVL